MTSLHNDQAEWTNCSLGDVLQIIRGVSYTKEQASSVPGDNKVPILRATNINGVLDFNDLVYVPGERVSDEQKLQKGDIVIAASSGSKSVVGKAAQLMADWNGSFGVFCMGLRPKGGSGTEVRWIFSSIEGVPERDIQACSGIEH